MLLASEILNGDDGVRVTLLDAAKRTWSDNELLGYLNEFLRTTAHLKPDSYTKREFLAMAAGTKQQLPEDGVAFMDAGENEASGRIATMVSAELLAHANRFHPAATPETDVQHWTADPRDPRRFDVTPPNNGYGSLEVLYGAVPPELTALGDTFPLSDSYQYAARCFVMGKAYAKNSQRQNLGKSQVYMNDYRQALGLKSMGQAAVAPRLGQNPGEGD